MLFSCVLVSPAKKEERCVGTLDEEKVLAQHAASGTLRVKVKTRAAKTGVLRVDERGVVHIAVAEAPERGKANAALVRFVSKALKRPVSITSGFSSREKLLRVEGKKEKNTL
ncbi:DUF167 domain-containing protein [Candidatus Woesearchaeota archaeon]|nr:MAG: DUF167 domain-containing protein [Candidatus Woesearchaeota archaeon]